MEYYITAGAQSSNDTAVHHLPSALENRPMHVRQSRTTQIDTGRPNYATVSLVDPLNPSRFPGCDDLRPIPSQNISFVRVPFVRSSENSSLALRGEVEKKSKNPNLLLPPLFLFLFPCFFQARINADARPSYTFRSAIILRKSASVL